MGYSKKKPKERGGELRGIKETWYRIPEVIKKEVEFTGVVFASFPVFGFWISKLCNVVCGISRVEPYIYPEFIRVK